MLWSIRKLGDVFHLVLGHHKDVVFSISACARRSLWDHDHGLHGDHHAGLDHCVYVLPQLQL